MKNEKKVDIEWPCSEKRMTNEELLHAERLFKEMISDLQKHRLPNTGLLKRAYKYALSKHEKHRRLNGEPYIIHDLAVAKILTEAGFESHLIAAAILHDMVNHGVTIEELEQEFGIVVADTVHAVSRVSESFDDEQEMEKKDIQNLSDIKFLKELNNNNQRAFYIKLADEIHNMRTIEGLPEDDRLKKTRHVRNIILPVAKKIHVFRLVETLESLCLKEENPIVFQMIQDNYRRLLFENRDTLTAFQMYFRKLVLPEGDSLETNYVEELFFVERFENSIFRHLTDTISDMNHLEEYINKKNVPLYDINLIISEAYEGNPQDIFMKYYPMLYKSSFRITIVDFGYTVGTEVFFYKMVDRYGNYYRLFVQKQLDFLKYSQGIWSEWVDTTKGKGLYINEAEPDEPEHKQIQVYRKDGKAMLIDDGATVLDFAFALHRDIGICARHALLNGTNKIVDLDTRLKPGDRVHVISDHFQGNEEKDIPHATIRWFEYIHTRQATKALARWMEKNMDRAMSKIQVRDSNKIYSYEIDKGATALDLAFMINAEEALHVEHAYLSNRHNPIRLERILRQGDAIRFSYNKNSKPKFSWLTIVKTKLARETLIEYFERTYDKA